LSIDISDNDFIRHREMALSFGTDAYDSSRIDDGFHCFDICQKRRPFPKS
jgi:hypothetical protein